MKKTGLLLVALLSAEACGGDGSDFVTKEGMAPFGGRDIKFQSSYAYFPSDFAVSIVRDTMPQDEACRLLKKYTAFKPPLRGLPVLPYEADHHTLVVTVESVLSMDDVSIDPSDRGGLSEMRYAILGEFRSGKNTDPSMSWPAKGVVRIAGLTQYQRVQGSFRLTFPGGEQLDETFDVASCPSTP